MRKTVLTIGLFFICLWVFTFCNVSSWATPNDDIVPINAVLDLSRTEKQVDDQEKEVDKAWVLVDESSTKWATMLDENRRKTASNFLIEAMGTGFWALTGGLDGRLESEMRSYYANKSLMDLYSDELENVKSEIDMFNLMVPVYYSAHAYAETTVNKHYAQHHDAASPSNTNHFLPSKDTKTCRDSLPSFLCRGVTTLRVRLCVTCLMAHRMRLSIRIARSVAKKSTLTAIRRLFRGMGLPTTPVIQREMIGIECAAAPETLQTDRV